MGAHSRALNMLSCMHLLEYIKMPSSWTFPPGAVVSKSVYPDTVAYQKFHPKSLELLTIIASHQLSLTLYLCVLRKQHMGSIIRIQTPGTAVVIVLKVADIGHRA